MKPTRILRHLISFCVLAGLVRAQTAIWLGQSPPDPNRLSSWTDPSNWSTGTVPDGPAAVAQLDQAIISPAGLIGRDNLQILNTAITLDRLQYGLFTPYYYYYPYLTVPTITIGGTGAGDSGSLEFVGSGIGSLTVSGYYYPASNLILKNGALRFSGSAAVGASISITAVDGANQIWFGNDSRAANLSVTLGAGSRFEFAGRARFENGSVTFNGGHVGFAGQSSFRNSSFSISGPGLILFADDSTAINPTIYFNRAAPANDSIVNFSGRSSIQGGSAYSYSASGVIEFTEQANPNAFSISGVRQLDVTGATTGTGSTGRLRATVNTPTATSVVADDARTLNLGYVGVTDLLLGSNSVQLNGGNLNYISDVGGAYLSATGSNLTGGGIIQNGYNSLYLGSTLAASPYAVPLTIISGYVSTNRQKLGPVTINPGGYLIPYSGSAASIVNNGMISMPTQISPPYQVTGNYTQSSTGNFSAGYISHYGSNSPLLEIAGQASLAGTLNVYNSGYFVGTRRVTVLRAGSITGRFTTAPNINLSPMLFIGTEYTNNDVFISYTQRPFVNAGATPSQQALGAHLDATLANATGPHYNLIYYLNTLQNPATIAAGLGELAPDRYGVLSEQGFATAAARQAATDRRLAGLRTAPAAAKGITFFVESGQVQNNFAALEGLPGVAMKTSGSLAGVAWRKDRWTAGATIASERTLADLDAYGGHARIQATTPGFFVQYDTGRFFVSGAAGRSNDKYTLLRGSGLFARTSLLSAAVSGKRTDLSLTTGTTYTNKAKDWSLTPYAGILSSVVRLGDFAEKRVSGSTGTELAFKNWSVGSLRTRVGFDLARETTGGKVTPRVSVVWLHELEKEREFSTGLVGTNGAMYRAPGRPAETDIVQAGIGLDWRINRRLTFSLNAGLARGRNSDTTSDLSAGFRWEF